MSNRPAIPMEVQREVLFEARHRCAVCCEPTPLEKAHIRPWSKSKDHSVKNLIALCANCHERADHENWGENYLSKYKKNPCALAVHVMPPMSPDQKAMVDFVIASNPDAMTKKERQRFVSMAAAFAGVPLQAVHLESVMPTNSSRVRISTSHEAAHKFVEGFQKSNSLFSAFFDGFEILSVGSVPNPPDGKPRGRTTDTSEKGLETLIIDWMAEENGYKKGNSEDYDRDHAVDLVQLQAFVMVTQPKVAEALSLAEDGPKRTQFLHRLQGEIAKRGVIDVLGGFRNEMRHRDNCLK